MDENELDKLKLIFKRAGSLQDIIDSIEHQIKALENAIGNDYSEECSRAIVDVLLEHSHKMQVDDSTKVLSPKVSAGNKPTHSTIKKDHDHNRSQKKMVIEKEIRCLVRELVFGSDWLDYKMELTPCLRNVLNRTLFDKMEELLKARDEEYESFYAQEEIQEENQ